MSRAARLCAVGSALVVGLVVPSVALASTTTVQRVVAYARAQVGKPYHWGSAGPYAFDCSGLTMRAWEQAGVHLPHSSGGQYAATRRISRAELQPGDLVFYYTPISHVALYVGGGMQVAGTQPGDEVRLQPIHSQVSGYGRVVGGGGYTPVVERVTHPAVRHVPVRVTHDAKRYAAWHGRYVVHSGDTLSGIGLEVGRSWEQLWRANAKMVHDPDLIFPGQRLRVPGKNAPGWARPTLADRPRHHTTHTTTHQASTASVTWGVWARIAQCESGGTWAANTGNGFYGGLQFTLSSWRAAGGSGMPNQASPSEQIRVAVNLQRMQGWGAWPVCSRKAGM
jgi:LysM repeat protein